jgi:serine protease Do
VAPAVVVIETDKKIGDSDQRGEEGFQFFFQNPQNQPGEDEDTPRQFRLPRPPSKSEGSGFITRADGFILTNNHVIADADKIEVRLKDGRHLPAKVIGTDDRTDMAVLKVEANNLPVAELGDSDAVRVGQLVCSIGVPYSLDYSFTAGWVSAKGRSNLTNTTYEDYIQTDAFINPGNSGGPLFDVDGKVIGMNTLINGIGRGLAFAIPSNMLKEVSDQLITNGKVTRPWLGIGIKSLSDDQSLRGQVNGIDDGVVVQSIQADAPAYKSELRPADVIVGIDGQKVTSAHELQKEVLKKKVGQTVKLSVWRGGKTMDVAVTTGELPGAATAAMRGNDLRKESGDAGNYGLELQDLTPEVAEKSKVKATAGALVTNVAPNSAASLAGVQRGDVITEVDSQPVKDAATCRSLIEKHSTQKGVLLFIDRKGQKTYAVLKADKE